MKLFLISQDSNCHFDTYRSAVVIADNKEEAKRIHPDGLSDISIGEYPDSSSDWVTNPDLVTAEYLGEAKEGSKKGVVCADFCAG